MREKTEVEIPIEIEVELGIELKVRKEIGVEIDLVRYRGKPGSPAITTAATAACFASRVRAR